MDFSQAPAGHAEFLSCAMPVLKADQRFVGVGVGGSWLTGQLDEFSDLDLVLAVAPDALAAVNACRLEIAKTLGSLLAGFTGEHVGEPRLLICLYDKPLLHVDLKFVSVAELEFRAEDPFTLWERDMALTRAMSTEPARFPMPDSQWIEDRFWIWVHYAATKLGRGELFEVIDFLAFLREQVFGPLAAALNGREPRGVRKLERALPKYVPAFERTLADRTPRSCADALLGAVDLYRALRDTPGGPRRDSRLRGRTGVDCVPRVDSGARIVDDPLRAQPRTVAAAMVDAPRAGSNTSLRARANGATWV
jgi:hypothetical protein